MVKKLRCGGLKMSHEIPKLLLEHAGTFLERREAIKTALSLGMPLDEIEAYLDWLDTVNGRRAKGPESEKGPSANSTGPSPS